VLCKPWQQSILNKTTIMKLLLIILFTTILSAFTLKAKYPVVKLYAYQQKVSKVANFSSAEKNAPSIRHSIYIEVRKGRNISVDAVWLNGRKTEFSTEEVSTPVMYEKSIKLGKKNELGTLVPATGNNVLQVVVKTSGENPAVTIPSRYRQYPILLEYREGSKQYFLGSKTWEELEPELNQ
jgi:hypothetical protein